MPEAIDTAALLNRLQNCADVIRHHADVAAETLNQATDSKIGTTIQGQTRGGAQEVVGSGGDAAVLALMLTLMPGMMEDAVEAALLGIADEIAELQEEVTGLRGEYAEAKKNIERITQTDKDELNRAGLGKAGEYTRRALLLTLKAERSIRKDNRYDGSLIDGAVGWMRKAENELQLKAPSLFLNTINKLSDLRQKNYIVLGKLHKALDDLSMIALPHLYKVAASIMDATPILLQILRSGSKELDAVHKYMVEEIAKAATRVRPARKLIALGRIRNTADTFVDAIQRYSDYINPEAGGFMKRTKAGSMLSVAVVEIAKRFNIDPNIGTIHLNKATAMLGSALHKTQVKLNIVTGTAISFLDKIATSCNTTVNIINDYAPTVSRGMELLGRVFNKNEDVPVFEMASMVLRLNKSLPMLEPRAQFAADMLKSAFSRDQLQRIRGFMGQGSNDMSDYLGGKSSSAIKGAIALVKSR